ncbi:anti-sigma factor family protein [Planctomycetota bacterium]
MNSHEQIIELLADYVLGELPEQQSEEVKAHLSRCPICRDECQRLAALEQCTHQIQQLSVERQTCESARQSLMAAMGRKKTEKPTTSPKAGPVLTWRSIMKSKISKLTAAAAVLIGVIVIGFWSGNNGGAMAYGVADVPRILFQADTVHMRGIIYIPVEVQPGQDRQVQEIEYWCDMANKRWRMITPNYSAIKGEINVWSSENIYDGGQFQYHIDHGKKSVLLEKISEFKQNWFLRHFKLMIMQFVRSEQAFFDDYEKVGQEVIEGHQYDIWELILGEGQTGIKMRSWVSPSTGALNQVKVWQPQPDGQWVLGMHIDLIELNVEMPAEVFSVDIAADYTFLNTPETASESDMYSAAGSSGPVSLQGYAVYVLPNGGVITCWSSRNEKAHESDTALLEKAIPGSEFPPVSIEVHSLEARYQNQSIIFPGRFLAYSQKFDRDYVWGLYLPLVEVDTQLSSFWNYTLIYRDNRQVQEPEFDAMLGIMAMPIQTKEDFEVLVRGNMAELSDTGGAPDYVTYDYVLRICEDIRRSIHK